MAKIQLLTLKNNHKCESTSSAAWKTVIWSSFQTPTSQSVQSDASSQSVQCLCFASVVFRGKGHPSLEVWPSAANASVGITRTVRTYHPLCSPIVAQSGFVTIVCSYFTCITHICIYHALYNVCIKSHLLS